MSTEATQVHPEERDFALSAEVESACSDFLSGDGIIRVYQHAEYYLADSMPDILAEIKKLESKGTYDVFKYAQHVVENVEGQAWLRADDVRRAIEKAREEAATYGEDD